MEQRVLVTGANGFLGSHVVKQLLLAGYRVRGTLRNIEDRGTIVAALKKLVPDSKHELEFVDVDLLCDKGWDSAMSGCSSVIHTAFPVNTAVSKFSDDFLMDHAVNGGQRVIKAAVRAGVKQVVITSTINTVLGGHMPLKEGAVYTENDWTELDFPGTDGDTKAKTTAEKAAWNLVATLPAGNKLSLTILLPAPFVGPLLVKPTRLAGLTEVIDQVMNNVYPALPNITAVYSDVRDVAECHVKALTTPAAEGQRILLMSESAFVPDVVKMVAKEFRPQGYTIYTNTLSAFMLWLPSLFDKRITKIGVFDRIDKKICFSNKKMKDTFGINPRPLNDSLLDMIYSMVDIGITFKAKKYKQVGSRATLETE